MHSYPQAREQARRMAGIGDLRGAIAVLEPVVEAGRPGLATGDRELLTTMRELAGLYTQADDPSGARRLLEEAHAAGRRVFGVGDSLMVLVAFDLGVVAEELANRHEARRNFGLVAEHGVRALGAEHPAVMRAREFVTGEEAPRSPAPGVGVVEALGAGAPGAVAAGAPTVPLPTLAASASASGAPVAGGAVSGQPVSGAAVPFGPPVSGAAVPLGQPVSGGPGAFGEPRGAGRSRTPWIIAVAAVTFVVVMLVVVLVRPGAEPDGAPVAGGGSMAAGAGEATAVTTPSPAPTAGASATASATASTGAANPGAVTKRTADVPVSSAPSVATKIVTPKNGSGVKRSFTVTFSVSAADLAATDTRLALTVCVKEWCFLEGPITLSDGGAKNYPVTLGPPEGEGIGERWTVRVDRLTQAEWTYLRDHKQAAVDAGTWGDGVSTPRDRLNKSAVSSVVVTKTT